MTQFPEIRFTDIFLEQDVDSGEIGRFSVRGAKFITNDISVSIDFGGYATVETFKSAQVLEDFITWIFSLEDIEIPVTCVTFFDFTNSIMFTAYEKVDIAAGKVWGVYK